MLIWSRPHRRVGPSSAPWWGHGSSEAVCDQGDQLESRLCTGQAQVSSACTELQKRPVGKPDQWGGLCQMEPRVPGTATTLPGRVTPGVPH